MECPTPKGNDTMAYVPSAVAPPALNYPEASATKRTGRGLWLRLFDAMVAARQRQAEREIERYLHDTGWKFTDSAEREIEARFLFTPSQR